MIVRHLLSIALLPFVVVVLMPRWLLVGEVGNVAMTSARIVAAGRTAGAVLFVAGFTLFVWCVVLFARVGRGTLAPWDPTQRLVVVGPYRHVRNPMITAVCTMLAGEALYFHSAPIGWWFLFVVALNHAYFIVLEEPGLEARFGDEYARYRAAVPRWIPRRRGWP